MHQAIDVKIIMITYYLNEMRICWPVSGCLRATPNPEHPGDGSQS